MTFCTPRSRMPVTISRLRMSTVLMTPSSPYAYEVVNYLSETCDGRRTL